MNLLDKFSKHVSEHTMLHKQFKSLVAVSGGVDSVVLCDLLYKCDFDFVIAHCNFQLRGEESERDEQFVRSLGVKYNRQVLVNRFDTSVVAEQAKISIQEAARTLRYAWFHNLMEQQVASPLLTAHHADDNIETAAMNFFRGTGLKGLTGIPETRLIKRPLLPFRKQEIRDYAEQINLSYVEDSSNALSKYTRNFFRNELLPQMQQVFPQAEENILKNIERLKDVDQVYTIAIKNYKDSLIEKKGEEEHIPILKLKKIIPYRTVLWEILKEKSFSAAQVDEVIKLFDADNGSFIDSEFFRIIKNRKWLIVTRKTNDWSNIHFVIEEDTKRIEFNEQQLLFEKISGKNFQIPTSSNVACVDATEVQFPLLLRKWKQGDYFYPLGMRKKKKLSRFFIDIKLSKTEKENVWILESNKRVVWIVGYRIDDRFKITSNTKSVLKITRYL
jgi:tRNA(Ile)-lysidine synthase